MSKKWAGLFAAALVLAICLPAFAEEAPAEKPYGSDVGKYLKEFKLNNPLDGKTYALPDMAKDGKDTALIFMQTACSLCIAEVREFQRAKDRLEGNLNVFLVSVDIDAGRIKPYVAGNNIDLPIVHDGDATLLEGLKFNSTPALVVVDKTGKIKVKKSGFDAGEVRAMIKEYSK